MYAPLSPCPACGETHTPDDPGPELNRRAWWSYLVTRRDLPAALDPCITAIAQRGCGRVSPSVYVRWEGGRQLAWLVTSLGLDATTAEALFAAAAKPANARVRRSPAARPRPESEGAATSGMPDAGLRGDAHGLLHSGWSAAPPQWLWCAHWPDSAPNTGGGGYGEPTGWPVGPYYGFAEGGWQQQQSAGSHDWTGGTMTYEAWAVESAVQSAPSREDDDESAPSPNGSESADWSTEGDDLAALRAAHDAMRVENAAVCADNERMRVENASLRAENERLEAQAAAEGSPTNRCACRDESAHATAEATAADPDEPTDCEDYAMGLQALYCSCRQPRGKRAMLRCSKCDEWFHASCEKVTVSRLSNAALQAWRCSACAGGAPLERLPFTFSELFSGSGGTAYAIALLSSLDMLRSAVHLWSCERDADCRQLVEAVNKLWPGVLAEAVYGAPTRLGAARGGCPNLAVARTPSPPPPQPALCR